jgi:hypothetical protein
MDHQEQIQALQRGGQSILALLDGHPIEQVRWKPAPQKWSLLEILNHLCDEERDDFRKRIALVLEDPAQPWPPIDPEGWARDRDYNSRDLQASLAGFRRERAASLQWLVGLPSPDWTAEHKHPKLGGLRAGDLLAAWVAHDLLHIRQIANTRLAWVAMFAEPYSTRYALP